MPTKRFRLIGVYLLALAAIVGPVAMVVYAARYVSTSQQQERAVSIAADVLRRTHRVSEQMRSAFAELGTSPDGKVCSERHMDLMRRMVVKSNMLIDVGFISGNQLLCSSFGHKPIDLGPPSYVSGTGNVIRIDVPHPLLPDSRLLVITDPKTGITAQIHEQSVLDMSTKDADLTVGVLGWTQQRALMERGRFDPAWQQWMGDAYEKSHMVDQTMVAIHRSPHYDYAAFVAIPASEMQHHWQRIALGLSPLGIATALTLLWVLVQYTRQQSSMPVALRQALNPRNNDFFLVYQPIVDLHTGAFVGAEALLRWRRDGGKLVSPDIFIPVAERHQLMGRVTDKVLSLLAWDAAPFLRDHPGFYIAVNLSAEDFGRADLPGRLHEWMVNAGVRRGALRVEATERVFMDQDLVKRNLKALRTQGIPVAIDDFGTGYSSLSYLTRLEVDCMKIDKAFVETISTASVTSHVVAHIIEMAKSLDLTMVAEGVETPEQAAYLRDRGVQFAQGWLFSRPVGIEQLSACLAKAPSLSDDGSGPPNRPN